MNSRFFKVNEPNYTQMIHTPRMMNMLDGEFSRKNQKGHSPARFYDMEKSDSYRRLRAPACLILKENIYNGHKGFYGNKKKSYNSCDSKTFHKPENVTYKEDNIEKNIIKELKVHGNIYYIYIYSIY